MVWLVLLMESRCPLLLHTCRKWRQHGFVVAHFRFTSYSTVSEVLSGALLTHWATLGLLRENSFWTAYSTTKSTTLGNWKWQIPTIVQLLCPVLIITSMLFVPESPRWLIKNGHIDRARKVLQATRPAADVEEELLSIQEAVAYEHENMSGVSYKYFFTDPSTRWRFFLAVMINFGQQATGQGSLNNYSTIIYKKVFASNSTIQLINALNATLGIIFTLNASCKHISCSRLCTPC